MKVVIVFDHPYGPEASNNQLHNRSFTAALLQATINQLKERGDTIDLIDLHKDNFNPVMDKNDLLNWRTEAYVNQQSQNYFERLKQADEIIMLFPIWWEMMPALTKGFIDKVFAKGQIIKSQTGKRLRRIMLPTDIKVRVLTVAGAPNWAYKIVFGNPLGRMLKRGVFGKMGIRNFKLHLFNAEDANFKKRQKMLKNINKYI